MPESTSSNSNNTITQTPNTIKIPRLHCGDLPVSATIQDVQKIFSEYNVTTVSLRKTPNNQYAYAYVSFETQDDLERALKDKKTC